MLSLTQSEDYEKAKAEAHRADGMTEVMDYIDNAVDEMKAIEESRKEAGSGTNDGY